MDVGNENWLEIFNRRPSYSPGPVPPFQTPRVPRPVCPEHCSGRHEHDGTMQCPHCKVPAYRIISHEWLYQEGHNFFSLEPMNGFKPGDGKNPVCNCGRQMVRA